MRCETCNGTPRPDGTPCPDCGGCGIAHCCDGLIEQGEADGEVTNENARRVVSPAGVSEG